MLKRHLIGLGIGLWLAACVPVSVSPTPYVVIVTATPAPLSDATIPVDGTPDAENRLVNPSFEGTVRIVMDDSIRVAEGWEPFYCHPPYTERPCLARGGAEGVPAMSRPAYWPTTETALIHSGSAAQGWSCNYAVCWGGLYQTFPTQPGEVCEVGAWVRSWSAARFEQPSDPAERRSDLDTLSDRDNVTWYVRVDPSGGSYAWASQVIASRAFDYKDGVYDQYAHISLSFTATGEHATVFFDSLRIWPFAHNENVIDDAYAICRMPEGPVSLPTPLPINRASEEAIWQIGSFTPLGGNKGDAQITAVGDVIRVEDAFWMYYAGPDTGGGIGLAVSSDGQTWMRRHTEPVFGAGPPGSWDQGLASSPAVLYDPQNGKFEMWYPAIGDPEDLTSTGIGYAVSEDGLHWQRVGNGPVIDQGPLGSWDEERIDAQDVVKVGNTYYLYYSATTLLPTFLRQIGCAVSSDGINWTQCPGNPVLSPDPELAPFEGIELELPNVVYQDGFWLMAYTGFLGPQGPSWRIGLARSLDGLSWERVTSEPLVTWGSGEQSTLRPVLYLDTERHLLWLWYSDEEQGGLVTATAPISRP